jgi:hypothetical protein
MILDALTLLLTVAGLALLPALPWRDQELIVVDQAARRLGRALAGGGARRSVPVTGRR